MARNTKQALPATKWVAIKNGAGEVKGYMEKYLSGTVYVTIPGVTRFKDAQGNLIAS